MTLKIKIQPEITRAIASSLDFLILLACGVIFILISKFESVGFIIFGILVIIFGIMQFVKNLNAFYLYENELIIKYPLTFTSKTNFIIKLNKIQQINFKRGRNPYMEVNLRGSKKIFNIDMSEKDINNFIIELNKLDIKTFRKNL